MIAGIRTIDRRHRRVTLEVDLTWHETSILEALYLYEGQIVPHETLVAAMYRGASTPLNDEHIFNISLMSLRRKLGAAAVIENVRGKGFRLRSPGPRRH